MKIIVLHGTDTKKLYSRLTTFIKEAKKRGWEISDFDLNKIKNTGLFDNEYLFIVRDYKSSLAGSTSKSLSVEDLAKTKDLSGNLVIYHEGNIPATFLKELKSLETKDKDKSNLVEEKYELPLKIFQFLNNININSFNEIIKTEAVEYVIAMMAWKFKQNYIKNPNENNARNIKTLAEIDVRSKTGKGSLINLINLFLAKYYS